MAGNIGFVHSTPLALEAEQPDYHKHPLPLARVDSSRPRHPQEQGITERGGGYVKDDALKGRRFNSIEELDAFLKRWNRTIARLRIHGTTRKQVYTHPDGIGAGTSTAACKSLWPL